MSTGGAPRGTGPDLAGLPAAGGCQRPLQPLQASTLGLDVSVCRPSHHGAGFGHHLKGGQAGPLLLKTPLISGDDLSAQLRHSFLTLHQLLNIAAYGGQRLKSRLDRRGRAPASSAAAGSTSAASRSAGVLVVGELCLCITCIVSIELCAAGTNF